MINQPETQSNSNQTPHLRPVSLLCNEKRTTTILTCSGRHTFFYILNSTIIFWESPQSFSHLGSVAGIAIVAAVPLLLLVLGLRVYEHAKIVT